MIASYLNDAPRPTQLAVLDMMRRGTIVADGSAYRKPRPFLVVALLTDDSDHGPLLTPHLVNALANLEYALIAMS